jgi:hypothetical protein
LRFARALLISAILAAAALVCVPAAGAAAPGEYQVKAVFLYNFTRFVAWPEAAFESATAPFVVGVFGADPFGGELEEVVRGEKAHGRPLVVRRVRSAADAASCHILFIPRTEDARIAEIVAAVDASHTLTVSDVEGAAQRGVIIRLVTQGGRIRMRINVESAKAANLTINSNLLRSAEIVGQVGGGGM